MKKIYLVILAGIVAITAGSAWLQESPAPTLMTKKVAGNIYMVFGPDDKPNTFTGGNIALSVGDDGVVMVDSKMPPVVDQVSAAIEKLGGASPRYLLNTHVHGDHTGGNPHFRDGTIIAQDNVRKRLVVDKPAETWPVITFDQSLSIYMNGEEIRAVHYPKSHTDGDAVIYFKNSNVVHMGDLFFNGMLPFIDLDSGGSVQGYKKHVNEILAKIADDTAIIPGHGPLATRADLAKYARMLDETVSLVTDKMKQGKRLEEIQKEGIQEEWQTWSWYFISVDKWIETIFKSYTDAEK